MRAVFFSIIVAVLSTITPAFGAQLASVKFAGWLVGAYSDDTSGAFSHCAASVPYKSGTSLLFSLGTNGWTIGLANPSWKLPPGASYPVVIQIDRNQPISLTAHTVTPELATAPLETSEYLFQIFRRGRLLRVQSSSELMQFDLSGSAKVLDLTLACAKARMTNASTAQTDNPFSNAQPASPSPTTSPTDHSAEITAYLANVLSAAGIQGFSLLPPNEPKIRPWQVGWAAPGLIGLARIEDNSTVEESAVVIAAADSSSCKGNYASTKQPSADGKALLLKTGCQAAQPDQNFQYSYTLVPRAAGGSYITAVSEAGNTTTANNPAADVGPRLLEASHSYLENGRR